MDLLLKIDLVKSDIQYKFKDQVWDISKGLMDVKWKKKKYISINIFVFS